MVVTIALETDEAQRAGAAAEAAGRIVLVPRVDGRYARVTFKLPDGLTVAVDGQVPEATLRATASSLAAASTAT
jgi:hypothetical protein